MKYTQLKREYKLVFDEDGNLSVVNLDGSEVRKQSVELWEIRQAIKIHVAGKSYIYIAKGYAVDTLGLHKIGISRNPRRRANELGAVLLHFIECSDVVIWDRESALHRRFSKFRVKGEWFNFDGEACIQELIDTVKTEKQLYEYLNPPRNEPSSEDFERFMMGLFNMFGK